MGTYKAKISNSDADVSYDSMQHDFLVKRTSERKRRCPLDDAA